MGNKIQKIYVGSQQVRPYKFNPTSNTIAYYPFSSNATDETGNTSLSNSGTQDGLGRYFTSSTSLTYTGTIQYVNMWIKINSYPSGSNPYGFCIINNIGTGYYTYHNTDTNINKKIFVWINSSWGLGGTASFAPTVGTWHNVSWGYDGTKTICSIDGVTQTLYNGKGYNFGSSFNIVGRNAPNITVSKLIIETIGWDSTKISNYYNNTKSNYGL